MASVGSGSSGSIGDGLDETDGEKAKNAAAPCQGL
jgi:hypothetical protein